MPRSMRPTIAVVLMSAFCLNGCSGRSAKETKDQPDRSALKILTVNYPLKYFADRIGGEQVDVVFPAPRDEDPAFWAPDTETVLAFQQADLVLLNGANYAKWVSRVTLPQSKLVNTSELFEDRYVVIKNAVSHSHGPGEEHAHDGIAFTTWLDPELAIAQAQTVYRALVQARPAHLALFDRNYQSLENDLHALDERFKKGVGHGASQPVVFSHPVFQYLQRRYRLDGKSVHWEPDEIPADDAWIALATLVKNHPATWMIWEGEPTVESVDRLLELGIRSAVFDPCSNTPESGDWLGVMNRNAEELTRVFSEIE